MNDHTIDKHISFLYNELDDFESQNIQKHLESCESCRKYLDGLKEVLEIYKMVPDEIHSKKRIDNIEAAIIKKNKRTPLLSGLLQNIFSPKLNWKLTFSTALSVIIILLIITIPSKNTIVEIVDNTSFLTDFNPKTTVFQDSLNIISTKIYCLENKIVSASKLYPNVNSSESVIDGEIRNMRYKIDYLLSQINNDEF